MTSICLVTTVVSLLIGSSFGLSFNYSYIESKNMVEIEISGAVDGVGSRYVAVAFASEPEMKDADGYYCSDRNELKSFTIRGRNQAPVEHMDTGSVILESIGVADGQLTCKFLRPVVVNKTLENGEIFAFDFSKQDFHVLLAAGDRTGGNMAYHGEEDREIWPRKLTMIGIRSDTCRSGQKGCLQVPEGCQPSDPECMFFSLRQEGDKLHLELSGGRGNGQQYVAVAFSADHRMTDADMYYCDGEALTSAVIRGYTQRPVDLHDEHVSVESAGTVNGVGQCRFTRDVCVNKYVSNGNLEKFDLGMLLYYILFAHGDMSSDGKMEYHGASGRGLSESPLSLADGSNMVYQCVNVTRPAVSLSATTEGFPSPDSTQAIPDRTTSKAISSHSSNAVHSVFLICLVGGALAAISN